MTSLSSRIPLGKVNWTTSIFLIASAAVSLIGTPLYLWHYGIDLFQAGLFLFFVFATGLSITFGYHRLFAHRSFTARRPIEFLTLVFGACAFQNSVLDWASDHRRHHKHVDHDEDPYNINKGFFWAHMGWLLFKLESNSDHSNVPDLKKDKMVVWQHRWVQQIAVVAGLILPAGLGFLWNGASGALGAFLLAGVTRVVVVQHSTFFINSLCHTVGRRPYCSKTSARDSMLMAFLTFGEGYHNYHHTFQYDYRNGVSKWAWDPTKWAIWLMSRVGLTSELRRVAPERIVLAQMRNARREAERKLAGANEPSGFSCPQWDSARRILAERYNCLVESYNELERAVAEKVEICPVILERWRLQTRELIEQMGLVDTLERGAAAA
jgi:stearoyl-CoA desaturase (delta-9 desaturase)